MRNRPSDHSEAVRLTWKARHIPFMSIIAIGFFAACVLSTFFSVWAEGPSNSIP
jgi:hypothetical protein